MNTQFHTYNEIIQQTEAWQQALEVTRSVSMPNLHMYDQVIFSGCGSTYYLSLAGSALFQELTGKAARAVPGGELLLNPQVVTIRTGDSSGKTLLVAVSRSGTTTETVRAVEQFKANKWGDVIAITNYQTDLFHLADYPIFIPKGQEESVAQTKSFASMYVAASALSARMAGRDDLLESMASLPRTGERLIKVYQPLARQLGEDLDFDRFYFLGSGIRYGLACEISLKMKEMTLSHSEPFHFLEFRHGPMSMVNEKTVVFGLVSQENAIHEKTVLKEMQALGGKVISSGEVDCDITFNAGIPGAALGVLYLPVLQLMATYRSLAKGLNPDRPNNLSAVIQLDL